MAQNDVVIIGAGLSGLVAAGELGAGGHTVLVVDKARRVGGRLATRRIGRANLDHGAQFFTTRSTDFSDAVAGWVEAGVVSTWCEGFDERDGYPRYRADGGMNTLAKHLAAQLPDNVTIVNSVTAGAAIPLGDSHAVSYQSSERVPDEATGLIITSPVPQTLDLLAAGGVPLPPELAPRLRSLTYHSVIALLVTLDQPAPFGPTGALQRPDDAVFTFCADNHTKGISAVPAATFHTAHALSAELFDRSDALIIDHLRPEAEALLGDAAIETIQVKKWRYAGPVAPWPERCAVVAEAPAPLILCGDAFGGSKVEGAFLSGKAAAAVMTDQLR